jgi:hypothetical protein
MCSNLQVSPSIDLFATYANAQLPQIVPTFCKDQTIVRDALLIPWGEGIPYLHPPIPLVARCLRKVLHENVPAVLVLPDWKGQSWSVLLKRMTNRFVFLGKSEDVLLAGSQMTQKGDKLSPGNMVAHLLLPPYCI